MKSKITTTMWAFKTAWQINKTVLLGLGFLVTVAAILPAIALNYQRSIIDAIGEFISTGEGSFNTVLPTIVVFGTILAFIGLSNRLNQGYINALMYDKFYLGITERLSDGVMNHTLEEMMNKDKNDDFHRAVYHTGTFTALISNFVYFISSLVGTGALLAVAFSLSFPVFVISLFFIIAIIVFNLLFDKRMQKRVENVKAKQRLASHYLTIASNPEAAKEVRVFGNQNQLFSKWQAAHQHLYIFRKKQGLDSNLRALLSGFIFNIFVATMTIYSLYSLYSGNLEVAVLLLIFTLCMSISGSVSRIAETVSRINYGLHIVQAQRKVCEKKPSQPKTAENFNKVSADNLFETKGLSYAYPGGNTALDDVTLSIKKGEIIALVGVNGSGKSTLVNVLLQLFSPKGGEVYFDGQNYDTLENGFLKNKIGAFFQDYFLFHMPIHENVGFGDIDHINDRERITEALKKGGAYDFVQKLPKGEETYVDRTILPEGRVFSGGERQKLGVSRAHISDKDILIFDEPASMLDPLAELEQFEHIKQKTEGRTSVLISHRVGFARMADRIVLLDSGRIAEVGTHVELMKKDGLYANFFNEQAQWYQEIEGEK